jgi:tetratricopeptide (TPR) repeat protein
MPLSFPALLRLLASLRSLGSVLGVRGRPADSAAVDELLEGAAAARAGERLDEARALFERALRLHPAEAGRVAAIHHELGLLEAERGRSAAALSHFKSALRADRGFVPAALALGDAQERAGDRRDAVRTWERAVEVAPAVPLLARLERVHRDEGRPTRMIALYRAACERAPDDLALAVALGRVYLELEMLDQAADQFEKIEVRAPEAPAVHAFLASVFERRGQTPEAFDEYRWALRLARSFEWPHACMTCQTVSPAWAHRCPRCLRLNTLRPLSSS